MNRTTLFAQLSVYSVLGFVVCSVLPNAIAGKYAFTGAMLVLLCLQLFRRELVMPRLTWINASLLFIVVWSILSTVLSPMPADAFTNLRKDTLPFAAAYLLLVCQKPDSVPQTKIHAAAIWALLLGFAGKEALAVYAGVQNGFVFSIYESTTASLPKYLDFFATDTLFYLPILLAVWFFWPIRLWQKWFVGLVSIIAIGVVAMSGVRATFLAALPLVACFVLVRCWRYKWVALACFVAAFGAAVLLKNHVTNPSLQRYYSILSTQTYQFGKDGSVSERKAILKAVWDLSKDRLWVGYGPGWKKLPTIAQDKGYMQQWEASEDPLDQWAYRYFSLGVGRVNPHNIYAQTLFELGLPGLVGYLSLLLAVMVSGVSQCLKGYDRQTRSLAFAAITFVAIYVIFGMAGGVWLPLPLLVIMVCLSQRGNTRFGHAL